MPWALLVKPTGLPAKDPYTLPFSYLLWCYFLTDSDFSCLAMLAKPCPVCGPTHLPEFPNQLHCMSKGAHEVLGTVLEARLMSVFTIK